MKNWIRKKSDDRLKKLKNRQFNKCSKILWKIHIFCSIKKLSPKQSLVKYFEVWIVRIFCVAASRLFDNCNIPAFLFKNCWANKNLEKLAKTLENENWVSLLPVPVYKIEENDESRSRSWICWWRSWPIGYYSAKSRLLHLDSFPSDNDLLVLPHNW